jgi:hypothetical protein
MYAQGRRISDLAEEIDSAVSFPMAGVTSSSEGSVRKAAAMIWPSLMADMSKCMVKSNNLPLARAMLA